MHLVLKFNMPLRFWLSFIVFEILRERSHMTSARFWQILTPPPPSALSNPPDDVSICQTPHFKVT